MMSQARFAVAGDACDERMQWMSRPRILRPVAVLCFIALAGGYIACSQEHDKHGTHLEGRDEDQGHGLHTVDNARLREIMHGLTALEMERLQADAAAGVDTGQRIERLARDAARLADDARLLPYSYRHMNMNAESRRVFDNLAVQLRTQCEDLERLARGRKTDLLKAKMNEIINTCNDCHASFRGPQMAIGRFPA